MNIHIPKYVQEDYLNICKTGDFLKEKSGKEASLQEISDETGLSVEKIKFTYKKMDIHCTSLDAPVKHKKSETSGSKQKSEIIGDFSFVSAEQLLILKEELNKMMEIVLDTIKQFSEKNQSIFCEYFGLNENFQSKKLEEIAQEFSCSQSNINHHINRPFAALYVRLKSAGYEIQRSRMKNWLSEKFYLCYWLRETAGVSFDILK